MAAHQYGTSRIQRNPRKLLFHMVWSIPFVFNELQDLGHTIEHWLSKVWNFLVKQNVFRSVTSQNIACQSYSACLQEMFCEVAKRSNIAWEANSKCLTNNIWSFWPGRKIREPSINIHIHIHIQWNVRAWPNPRTLSNIWTFLSSISKPRLQPVIFGLAAWCDGRL